ncbi:MAG: hypothetical protein AAF489_04960 [Bacteroidota bacterium]
MDKDQHNIEAYLERTMTSEERLVFERRLAEEPTLSEAYDSEIAARELIKQAGRLELKNTLEALDSQMREEPIPKKVIPLWAKRAMRVAALLILFAGVYQVFLTFNGVDTSEVYDTYFEAYESPSWERDVSGTVDSNWKLVVESYQNAAYKEALPLLKKSKGEVPDYLISFYTGISIMAGQSTDLEQAIQNFDAVLATDNDYHQQSEWYKALALLKLEKKEEALTIFKRIVEAKNYQYEEAATILELDIK